LEGAGLVQGVPQIHLRALASLIVMPTPALFVSLDRFVMPWDPRGDARVVAAALVNAHGGHASSPEVSAGLGWSARRFNPAATILVTQRAVDTGNEVHAEWEHVSLRSNARTKAFIRDA